MAQRLVNSLLIFSPTDSLAMAWPELPALLLAKLYVMLKCALRISDRIYWTGLNRLAQKYHTPRANLTAERPCILAFGLRKKLELNSNFAEKAFCKIYIKS